MNTDPLYLLWQRTQQSFSSAHSENDAWNQQMYLIQKNGRGLEETLNYLYQKKASSFDEFLSWLTRSDSAGQDIFADYEEDVLSTEDLEFWQKNGYIVIKNAFTEAQCAAARDAIWAHQGGSPDNPESWYHFNKDQNGMMLVFYHHPALDEIRRSPKIRKAYEQLYGHKEIYPTYDKVSFNPPETSSYSFMGSPLHWDVNLRQPIPYRLQGLLYLNDVDVHAGAFHCVPGFHLKIGEWLDSLPDGVHPRDAAVTDLKPIGIPGKAGDFIAWHQALPHCATPNKGSEPRLVQYLTYVPTHLEDTPGSWI